jgi:hypothetical protein
VRGRGGLLRQERGLWRRTGGANVDPYGRLACARVRGGHVTWSTRNPLKYPDGRCEVDPDRRGRTRDRRLGRFPARPCRGFRRRRDVGRLSPSRRCSTRPPASPAAGTRTSIAPTGVTLMSRQFALGHQRLSAAVFRIPHGRGREGSRRPAVSRTPDTDLVSGQLATAAIAYTEVPRAGRATPSRLRGDDRNRTGVDGFAGRCVATPPRRQDRCKRIECRRLRPSSMAASRTLETCQRPLCDAVAACSVACSKLLRFSTVSPRRTHECSIRKDLPDAVRRCSSVGRV